MSWKSELISGRMPISGLMNAGVIGVHPLSEDATRAWDSMASSQLVERVEPLLAPVSDSHVRFVCISDTHARTYQMRHEIPPGDVLLHAGDFTTYGGVTEIDNFNKFLGTLPHRHKVVIAGNHELDFDPDVAFSNRHRYRKADWVHQSFVEEAKRLKSLLTNCTYLEDSSTQVFGIKIYGTPWQPEFCGWAFNIKRGFDILEKWNMIPDDTDILISHGPPVGHGDVVKYGGRAGCVELLTTVQNRVRPKFHVFGHIHEGYGITTDGQTVFINCSICDVHYKAVNAPIVFDFPLPDGVTKD